MRHLSRQFIAWDGEGVTVDGKHAYILFANSLGDYITGTPDKPLGYRECFDLLLRCKIEHPKAIHVVFGGNYDTNMMLKGISRRWAERVYRQEWASLEEYRVSFRSGKCLRVHRAGTTVTLYDVFSFFQTSFVKACDSYLGDDWPNAELVRSTKKLRSTFSIEDLPEIVTYCQAELDTLVMLMDELRSRLNKVNLRISRWDGPGAIAATLLRREGVKKCLEQPPEPVSKAARYAYAGGRFELVKCGHVDQPVYEYDINSAYPSAMRFLPILAGGRWEYVSGDPGSHPFALYHIRYNSTELFLPSPLFRRGYKGDVSFPSRVTGWYWSPEYELVKDDPRAEAYEGWVFHPSQEGSPFEFISPLYAERQSLKAREDGAHVGVKLGMNSIYGKLAQQLGWKENPLRLPPFHQLEYAGYITSFCRAQLWRACSGMLDSVVAFETDAIFSTEPMPHLTIGKGLGEWEPTVFRDMTYIQSGFYYATKADGQEVVRERGFDRGTISRMQVLASMESEYQYHAQQTRFVTLGAALQGDWRRWAEWETRGRSLTLSPIGKRIHTVCPQCDDSNFRLGVWHNTYCPVGFRMSHSAEFPVEWIHGREDNNDRTLRWG